MNKRIRMIECDDSDCKYLMTEQEWEDFPQCPNCHGHYVTVILVQPIKKEKRKHNIDRRIFQRVILVAELVKRKKG